MSEFLKIGANALKERLFMSEERILKDVKEAVEMRGVEIEDAKSAVLEEKLSIIDDVANKLRRDVKKTIDKIKLVVGFKGLI